MALRFDGNSLNTEEEQTMFNVMDVAGRIRAARNRLNMTQMALADEMGVSYQAVSNWERGNSLPDIGKLPDLCRILHVSVSDLLGDEQETETVLRVVNHQTVEPEKLAGIAPMVPPEEMTESVREILFGGSGTVESFLPLLPYMEDKDIEVLARKTNDPENLRVIAFFLSTQTLNNIAEETEDIQTMEALAPFLPEKTLERYVERKMTQPGFTVDQIEGLLAFLGKETIKKLVAFVQDQVPADQGLSDD